MAISRAQANPEWRQEMMKKLKANSLSGPEVAHRLALERIKLSELQAAEGAKSAKQTKRQMGYAAGLTPKDAFNMSRHETLSKLKRFGANKGRLTESQLRSYALTLGIEAEGEAVLASKPICNKSQAKSALSKKDILTHVRDRLKQAGIPDKIAKSTINSLMSNYK